MQVFHKGKHLDVSIDLDDHISLVFKKIAYKLRVNPNNIYCWVKIPVSKYIIANFMHNLFRSQSLVEYAVLAEAAKNYFEIDIPDYDHKMMTKETCIKLLKGASHAIHPVSHYFMDADYLQFLPYKPNAMLQNVDTSSLYNRSMLNFTLDSSIGNVDNVRLNVVTTNDITHNHELYFPLKDTPVDMKKLDKLVEYVINGNVTKTTLQPNSYLNVLYLKSKDLYKSPIKIDLAPLFNDFKTSENVPFIKYKAYTNIFYKAYKRFLVNAKDVRDFERWYALNNFKLQDNAYIVLKVRCGAAGAPKYVSVIINDRLEVDVRLNFQVKDEEKIDNLEAHFKDINTVLKATLGDIPYLPQKIRDMSENYVIHRLVSYNVASLHQNATKAFAESYVKSKMFAYFDILSSDTANVMRLQYKKVDNFGKSENIYLFIQRHRDEPKDEVIEKIEAFFSISKDDAENEYEKWELQKESRDINTDDLIKYETYVEIKVRFNSPVDVRFIITGATSMAIHKRIVTLVCHILESAATKARETKKDAEAKKMHDEAIQSVVKSPVVTYDDDDDDWLNELAEIENEFKNQEKPDVEERQDVENIVKVDDKGKLKLKGFVKRMLDSADRDLFNYKNEKKRHDYASMCGWVDRRQPIVINEAEKKKIDRLYPEAYEGYVKTGSTPELEKRNFYICPKVWCPQSRLAITPEVYKSEGCPGGEEAIVFESKTFWGLGDKSFNRSHYPGFLDKYTRPDGLCLPCCFKISPSEGNRNKQRQDLCVPKTQEDMQDVVLDDAVGTEKYIKGDNYYPLEMGRYGLLTKDLQGFLEKTNCGSRHNGTGLMTDKTDCYLRRGIFHGNQSFIHCIISCMENSNVSSYKDFITLMNTRFSVHNFISLENGQILKLFVDRSKSIFAPADFSEFRDWFLEQDSYIAAFNLTKLKYELTDHRTFSKDMMFYKDVIREFMIYYAYKNFMGFLNSHDLEKDHRILLDLFNTNTDWLNVNEYNFVVLEITSDGKVFIDCSINRSTTQFVNKKAPFVFLVKQTKYYEPLCHVKISSQDSGIPWKYKFDITDKAHPKIKDLLTFFYQNCTTQKENTSDIPLFLESKGFKPKYYVIDYDFRLCGLILSSNLYVPFQEKRDIFALRGLKFVYISDIVLFKCQESKDNIRKVYTLLRREYGDFYQVKTFVRDNDIVGGIVLSNDMFIPVNVRSNTLAFKRYLDELYIFTGEQEEDPRTKFERNISSNNDIIKRALTKLDEGINEDIKLELMFLRDAKNPLPLDFKRKKISDILKKFVPSLQSLELVKIAELVMNPFFDVRRKRVTKFKTYPDEILFDFQDVQEGRLNEVIEKAQNPYKLFHKKLDALFDEYVFLEEEHSNDMSQFISSNSKFLDVPVKYGTTQYRKILKGFNILENNNDIVYDLFSAVSSTTLKSKQDVSVLKSIMKTNIVKDYQTKTLASLESNPSFANHLKKMKIKGASLDDILNIVGSLHYRPSFYEIRILARAVNVNIILIGRQTIKNPEGLFEVIYTRSPFYLFLVHGYDRFNIVDNYQLVVKDKKDILLSKREIPTEIIEMINAYLEKVKA